MPLIPTTVLRISLSCIDVFLYLTYSVNPVKIKPNISHATLNDRNLYPAGIENFLYLLYPYQYYRTITYFEEQNFIIMQSGY